MYLVAAVAALCAAGIYILRLQAQYRDCLRYIQDRLDKANPGLAIVDSKTDKGQAPKATPNPTPVPSPSNPIEPSLLMESTTTGTPKLLVACAETHRPFLYRCSHCSRSFTLPADQPLKEAVAELVDHYTEHIEDHHPAAPPTPTWTH